VQRSNPDWELSVRLLADLTSVIKNPQFSVKIYNTVRDIKSYVQVLKPLLLIVMEAVHTGRDYPMLMSLHLSILSRLILGK
jgi:hypothetical protein